MDIDIQITLGDLLKFHNMKQDKRGGKRENSGRKQLGNVQYQRRINPALVEMMDKYLEQLKIEKL